MSECLVNKTDTKLVANQFIRYMSHLFLTNLNHRIIVMIFNYQDMDTDTDTTPEDTVWGDCWLVEQLRQPQRTVLIILFTHAHSDLVTESSSMGNLGSDGSMEEASSWDSRNGSDEIDSCVWLLWVLSPKHRQINIVFQYS